MRKLLGVLGTLVLIAIALPGAAHPQPVGACGWYLEQANAQWVPIYDYTTWAWTWVRYEVDTYNDGCGTRTYLSSVVVLNGTPMSIQATIRVWVCGAYQGATTTPVFWTSAVYVWSNTYFYGPCPRQADNSPSWTWSPSTWPASTSAYVTQG